MAGKKAWGGDPAGQSSIPYARAAARIPRARAGSDENIGKTNRIACRVRPKSSTGGQKIHGGGTHPWRNPIPLPLDPSAARAPAGRRGRSSGHCMMLSCGTEPVCGGAGACTQNARLTVGSTGAGTEWAEW